MRIPESKIKEGILHPDEEVRLTALEYFARSRTADDTIMPVVIEAVQRYGRKHAFDMLREAEDLPQTKASTRWLLEELRSGLDWDDVEDDNYGFAIALILCQADLEQLAEPADDIVNSYDFPNELKDWLFGRLAMQAWDWPTAWAEFERFGREVRDQDAFRIRDFRRAKRIVEALARHHDKREIVLALLERRYRGFEKYLMESLEPFVVELAGRMRLKEAVPILIERMHEDDSEVSDSCMTALQRIGGDRVVQAIADDWPEGDKDFRQGSAGVLECIHSDLSVETCLGFFAAEEYEETKDYLAHALLGNFVPEAIEPIRRMVSGDDLTVDQLALRLRLTATATIMGTTFPDYEAWYEEAKQYEWGRKRPEERDRIREHFREDEDVSEDQDLDEDAEDEEWDEEDQWDEEDLDESGFDEGPYSTGRLTRDGPPVGRNDPCPCGSGKKYKKCCMGRERQGRSQQATTSKFPMGTLALYGPDGTRTTKIVAAVFKREGAEPILKRWVGSNVKDDPKVRREIGKFFKKHGVRSVAASDRNMGCPHEEGIDFPEGHDCPFCPWWKGKQGSARRD